MRKYTLLFISSLFFLFAVSQVEAHEVNYGLFEGNTVALSFSYSGGEPMSYVEAKVFSPKSSPDLEFQNGRTDARGIFAFVPDQPGTWRIEVHDNQGHKAIFEGEIREDDLTMESFVHRNSGKSSMVLKGLLALSLISNLALIAKNYLKSDS